MIYNFVHKMFADYLFQKINVQTLELHSILIYFFTFSNYTNSKEMQFIAYSLLYLVICQIIVIFFNSNVFRMDNLTIKRKVQKPLKKEVKKKQA